MSKKWYVYTSTRNHDFFTEDYWTGEMTPSGNPQKTNQTYKAKGFDTPREAYHVAGRTRKMDWWRVGLRDACDVFH